MLKSLGLWLSAGVVLSSSVVAQANPMFWQILSQNNGQIPDIVIDDNPSNPQTPPPPSNANKDARFTCEIYQGQYTVMYHPESQPGQAYPWAVPSRMGGGWSPEKRCNAISDRLESYRPDGLLELRTGLDNGYDTLCVTTVDVPRCRIVLTVPIGQNPEVLRDKVFDNLITSDSGQQVQGINTYTNTNNGVNLGNLGGLLNRNKSSSGLNLQQFLDPADRGTGTRLTNTKTKNSVTSPRSNPPKSGQFNPDSFR
jgi:hypothetical protein